MILTLLALTLSAHAAPAKPLELTLKDGSGAQVGTATLEKSGKGVKVKLAITKLSPGTHGIHFHEKGECKGPDFKSAGGHFNPAGKEHGTKSAKGPHAGDLGNFEVQPDGTATVLLTAEGVTFGKGVSSLQHPGGTALVIHALADDNVTQPSGNSGDRTACSEIH
jgi:Cu-Zn family superoxide dismutase